MTLLLLCCRASVRRSWRSSAALIVLLGVAGGATVGSAAAARRTDSAYTRFLKATNPSDLSVQSTDAPLNMDAIARLPEVAAADNVPYVFLDPAPGESYPDLSPLFLPDYRSVKHNRTKLLKGRRPDPDRADEVSLTPIAARSGGFKVGSVLRLQARTPENAAAFLQGEGRLPADGVIVEVRVVGIEVAAGALLPSESDEGALFLTPAFARQYGDGIGRVDSLDVKLRRGQADLAPFKAGVERTANGQAVQYFNLADDTVQVQRAIHLQAQALQLFALLVGLAALLALGQALTHDTPVDAADQSTLATLGLTHRQRWAGIMVRPAVVVLAGSVLTGAIAFLSSALTPFGIAREAEPDPGLSFDPVTSAAGLTTTFTLLLLIIAVPVWRETRTRPGAASSARDRPSALTERLARSGLSPSGVIGVRMAVGPGRSRSSGSTRPAMAGTALAMAALVAALTFGSSLQNLLHQPRLYGWNWDALIGNVYFGDLADQVAPRLAEEKALAGFSTITLAEADVAGLRAPAFGFDAGSGGVLPPITSGRAPTRPDEIVLGGKTLRDSKRRIGQTVTVQVGDRVAEMRIVGRGVLPALNAGDIAGLGEGALLTGEGLANLVPGVPRSLFAVRFARGVGAERKAQVLAQYEDTAGVEAASPPKRVANFGRLDNMPVILSGLLALIAGATTVHALSSGVRRRRRDFAILKALGFTRSQVRGTIAWQATTLTVIALAVGLPLGVLAGRSSWRVFAGQLGIVPEPVTPLPLVLALIPLGLLIANTTAILPGLAAARTRPAAVLRSQQAARS